LRNPITGSAGCCARAAKGHVATPPSSVINSRRLLIPVEAAHDYEMMSPAITE